LAAAAVAAAGVVFQLIAVAAGMLLGWLRGLIRVLLHLLLLLLVPLDFRLAIGLQCK
jgi:hypothetical protein